MDHVLGSWDEEELGKMEERLTTATDALITTAGLARAMSTYNGK